MLFPAIELGHLVQQACVVVAQGVAEPSEASVLSLVFFFTMMRSIVIALLLAALSSVLHSLFYLPLYLFIFPQNRNGVWHHL